MNNRRTTEILLAFCLIIVAATGYILVTALDRLRFELESLHTTVRALNEKVSSSPLRAVAPVTPEKRNADVPMANAQFFDPDAVSGDRFITSIAADTKNMNYLINNDATLGNALMPRVMDSLGVRAYDDLNKFLPQMAESWSVSPDGLRIRVKLREGILWHDFTDPVTKKVWKDVPVTSEDFKFYVDVVKNPKVDAAPMRTYLSDLDSVRVINDREFEVLWKKRYFLSLDMTLSLSPLPRHLYHAYEGPFDPERFNNDNERNRILVGCGPYRFIKWDKGHRILMTRWEKYYGARYGTMPPVKELAFDVIQHPNTRLQALLSKDLDAAPLTPDQWIHRTNSREFGPDGFLRKFKTSQLVYNYLGFNLSNPLFRDAKTRVALSHLVDRDRIVKDIYYGLAVPVSGPFFPEGPAYDKSVKPYSYSPELAKKLLAEAGWRDEDGDGILERGGQKFKFTLMYPNANETYKRMLPIIKEAMAKAGVQMELLGLEWSVCVQRLEKKSFDMCALGWSGGLNPDPFQLWHSSQADIEGSSNHIRFKNAEADRLIESIRVTFDASERQKLYHRFHRLVHEEQPYIFLFAPADLNALNSRYRNVREFPLGIVDTILWTPKAQQLSL